MRRNSYLGEDILQDIAGRLKFGATPLESKLSPASRPEPKPWTYPTHPLDSAAAEFGLKGFEYKALQDAAMSRMNEHAVLKHYYKRFLMAAKLVLDDDLEKVRQHERHLSEEKNRRDRTYVQKLREWEVRNDKLTKSWTGVRETIRTRWNKLGRSLAALLEQNACLGSMDHRDQLFIDLLGGRGILETDLNPDIDQRRVLNVDWDAYQGMSIEDINEVIMDLNNSSAGGFIKKPTKTPFNEA